MSDGYSLVLGRFRETAHRIVETAPAGSRFSVKPPRRTIPQNDLMWTLLGKLAVAKPQGRNHPPHVWKSIVMDAAEKKPLWVPSLDGNGVVCVGYSSSRLSKQEMSDVIEQIYAYAAENGVNLDD